MRTGVALAVIAVALSGCNQLFGLEEPSRADGLTGLVPSSGALAPAFDPEVLAYHLDVSVIAQRLTLTPQGPAGVGVRVAGVEVPIGARSQSIALPRGQSAIAVDAIVDGVTRTYTIDVDRGARDPVMHRLASTAPSPGGGFGVSIVSDGDRLVIGAPGEDPGPPQDCDGAGTGPLVADGGAVYVFARTADGYQLEQRLTRPADSVCTQFGGSVALDGDRLVVGDWSERVEGFPHVGAVHVYDRVDGTWTYQQRLLAPGQPPEGRFGNGIAAVGGWVLVGAPGINLNQGQAYAFGGPELSIVQLLQLPSALGGGQSGYAVAMTDDGAVVSAPGDGTLVTGGGIIAKYQLESGTWLLVDILLPGNAAANDYVGLSLAMEGDRIVAGAPLADGMRGEAHVFAEDTAWSDVGELSPAAVEPVDLFGNSVSLHGDLIATGWCRADVDLTGWSTAMPAPPGTTDAGAAFLYDAATTPPTFLGALGRDVPLTNALFGCIDALTDDRLFLGAQGEDDGATIGEGAVYVVE